MLEDFIISHSIQELSFLTGEWAGELGPTTRVEENWSDVSAGSMEARVKLIIDGVASTIELIRISEVESPSGESSIQLYVRQFSPELELRVSENMKLVSVIGRKAVFQDNHATTIRQLTYDSPEEGSLLVEVTFANNQSVVAELNKI